MNRTKTIASGAIVLYFIIGLEIMIMISPFAGFFYAVFNPFLLELAKYPATRWLSAFFLPHMVVPPDTFLKVIRIMGSVFFVAGLAVFIVCAIQVYTHKFLKRGAAMTGLYSVIRHPQYAGLGLAGLGLAILWPRFLVAVLWLVMILLYYLLAKDEERRMLKQDPDTYKEYRGQTGMFLPMRLERFLAPSTVAGGLLWFVALSACIIGGAFFLRDYTVKHLPFWQDSDVAALAIIPDDVQKMDHRMKDILAMDEVRTRLKEGGHYLVYFMPSDYIMQGLIADTGTDWRLYKHHHTIGMITDWIIHPFGHLAGGHHVMHSPSSHAGADMHGGVTRRLIFLSITGVPVEGPYDLLSIGAERTPLFMVDVELHDLRLIDIRDLPSDTGWGAVPTPVF
jgi:protein-S-isoprenylcysteine O-methyltransferase Ste14